METKFIEIVSNLLNSKNLPPLAFFVGLASFVAWYSFNGDLYYLVIGLALLGFSIYALIRYCYKLIQDSRKTRNEQRKKSFLAQKDNEQKKAKRIADVSHIFMGLSDENKHNLAFLVLKGDKDMVYDNRFIFRLDEQYYPDIALALNRAHEATTYGIDDIYQKSLVNIQELHDSTTVVFNDVLLAFVQKFITDNHLTLSSYEQQDE